MRRNSLRTLGSAFALGLLLTISPVSLQARDAKKAEAHIEVHGLGWFGNREQRASLSRLLGEERGQTLDANGIEDAAFLLMSALVERGYLKPIIRTELTKPTGETVSFVFDSTLESSLPRPFEAARVAFNVEEGVRYRFNDVQITGLRVIPEEVAREYFLGEKVLFRRASADFSKSHLARGLNGLEDELRRKGYADATVRSSNVRMNDRTGEVDVNVEVSEGARWTVDSLRVDAGRTELDGGVPELKKFVGLPWSQFWQQDVASAVRNSFFRDGYPDVQVKLTREVSEQQDGVKKVSVVAHVDSGPVVHVGSVRFEGQERTQEAVLQRRVKALPGKLLNPLEMDQARFRLGRLGVFESVDLRYEPTTGPVRDAVFAVREGRDLEANLLFGFGSYEQLRGGVEMRQLNLFGRAHQTRMLLVQSMKSSRGEYSYTVPELFGESIDGTARVFGLRRQETSFLRQEYGTNFSLSAPVHALGANATVGYTFQSLSNLESTLSTSSADQKQVNSASVDLGLVRDRRDNPLRPRRGYRWFAQVETASHYFGGTVDYQRSELGISYHTAMGRGRWLHLGLTHGFITTWGDTDAELPVNKRFFPGGDNSIRGYGEGEAAPLDASGRYVGAKTYLLTNIEFEQALTTKWSAVIFFDGLGTAVRLADYPWSERLASVGLGIRYQTLIGPLRIEYGRNLDPRPIDPGGTLLFSVGFPF